MANIKLKSLITEAENFKARSKETGKLVYFKSKDAYQAALKAGTHEDPKAKKDWFKPKKAAAKPNSMFGGDYAKDRGGEAPKADSMATVNSIAAKTGLRAQAVAGWADENGVNLSKVSADIDSKKLKPMDFMTAVSGNPGNKYAKDIIAKYSQSAPKADTSGENQKYDTSGETDYFEEYEQLPDNIKGLMDKHFGSGDDEYDYKELESIQKDFEANGWTFDFDLSGTPFELKPLPQSAPKTDTPKASNDKGDGGFGWGPETDRKKATGLPKKASQLDDKHASVVADALNKETGLDGYAQIDDNTGTIMFNASKGDEPTYTLYIGPNDDYGKPDEFRVSFQSTYGQDPSGFGDNIDKSFKTAEEAMAFAKKVAKKFKNELELDDNIRFRQDYNMYDDEDTGWMDDDNTNESTKLTSMIKR